MKKLISILLTVTMLCGTVVTVFAADAPSKEYPQKFYDVPKDHWAFSYIAELADRGVIAGYEDGSFKPNSTVTRAEWAKIMVGAAGIPTNDNNVYFSDMKNHWAIPYVNAAKDYLTAYADNTYRPSQAAVREDVTMAMVKLKGYDLSNVDYSYLNFTDTDSISNNIKQYVAVAVEKGLISGFEDNTFRGQATITRAEAATLLWRAFQYGNDNKVVEPSGTTIETPKPVELAKATEKPQATPKPTEKLKATPKPTKTSKPTVEPTEEPTPAPTPEPTEKPYKVDTLVKADVPKFDLRMGDCEHLRRVMTADSEGTIYYLADNKIYSVTSDGDTKELLDIDSLTKTNDFDEDVFEVKSMACDLNNNLYIRGYYSSDNYGSLYTVKDGGVELAVSKYNYVPLLILDNEYYVGWGFRKAAYLTAFGSDDTAYIVDNGSICAVEVDNNIIVSSTNGIYSYNYNTATKIADAYGAVGLSNTSYVIAKDNEFIIRNFDGTNEIRINKDDYEIKDKKSFNTSSIDEIMFLTPSNNIIFYDTNAKAFRMISENN